MCALQLDHYNQNELGWNIRMLCVGWFNNMGYGIMLAFLYQLSSDFDRNLQVAQFMVAVQAVPILARMYNANYLIQTPHDLRLFYVCLFQALAYALLACAMVYPTESIGIPCASLAAIIFQASRSIGEATIVGYIKAIPQELICTFGTGMGLGDMFQTLCQMAIVHFGMSCMQYFIFMSLSLVPYFCFFMYFERARLAHKQHKNVFKI